MPMGSSTTVAIHMPEIGCISILFYKFSSEIIEQKKNYKEYHGKNQGKADSSFSNDGSQRSADHEQDQAGNGHGNFFMPGHLMHTQVFAIILVIHGGKIGTGFDIVDGGKGSLIRALYRRIRTGISKTNLLLQPGA